MDYSYFALIPIIILFFVTLYCIRRTYDRLFNKNKNPLSENFIES